MATQATTRQQFPEWPEWCDLRTLGRYACVGERTLRDWIKAVDNPLPASQRNGKLYVSRSEFDEWMRRQRVTPAVDIDNTVSKILSELQGR
jgi:hypothetical protein